MFCSKCGRASDGSAFCIGCGASQQANSQPAMPQPVVVQTQYQQPQNFQNPYAPQQSYLPPQQPYIGPQQTNGKAIASLVLSLLGLSILGLIFGHVAASEIKNSGGRQGGSGMATAGIVLGWIGSVGWVFYWIGVVSLMNSGLYY